MTARFGQRAVALAGLAARGLGWRPQEFWTATPAELATALAPPGEQPGDGLGRADLDRMMETENGRNA